MKLDIFASAIALCTYVNPVFCYKGLDNTVAQLLDQLHGNSKRAVEMIGDLHDEPYTTTGREIKDCLLGSADCQNVVSRAYTPPGELANEKCRADKCCPFDYIGKELRKIYVDKDGECTQAARASIRLGFHDAGAWSKTLGYGGADGSILLNTEEIERFDNKGLEDIRKTALDILQRYKPYGVGAADLVQFMATFATVSCPLGPRVRTLVGRPDSAKIPPEGLMPDHRSNTTFLIKLFADKTISTTDLAALLGAHTTGNSFFINKDRKGHAFDSTPGVWDASFYAETLSNRTVPSVLRVPSDLLFARDGRTSIAFTIFSAPIVGQNAWNNVFAQAYVRVSLLGVSNVNKLTDCTKVLPNRVLAFTPKKGASGEPYSAAKGSGRAPAPSGKGKNN